MKLTLSQGTPQPVQANDHAVVEGRELSAEITQALFAQLPTLEGNNPQPAPFQLPDPLPPPLISKKIETTFPPVDAERVAPSVVAEPLRVLRYSPEGEVVDAPFISLTFNRPMVAIGELDHVPDIKIEPAIAGEWQWINSTTVRFCYQGTLTKPLPRAMTFRVTVSAEIQSLNNTPLTQPLIWQFSTPPLSVVHASSSIASDPLRPIFFIEFNTACDAQTVLAALHSYAGKHEPFALRVATEAEQQADKEVKTWLTRRKAARCVVFRPNTPLPPNTPISIEIPADTLMPTDGSLGLDKPFRYEMHTYKPLTIDKDAFPNITYYAGRPLLIQFNNPIDLDSFERDQVRIEPPLPDAGFEWENVTTINGNTQAGVTYRVTFLKGVKDCYGQTLQEDTTLTFEVKKGRDRRRPEFLWPTGRLNTLMPSSERVAFMVYSLHHAEFQLSIYAVTPADWPDYVNYLKLCGEHNRKHEPTPPGKQVLTRTMAIQQNGDDLAETGIELSEIVARHGKHYILVVRPDVGLVPDNRRRSADRTRRTWLQITNIGVDVFQTAQGLLVRATKLGDGGPVANANVLFNQQSATTDADGLAEIALTEPMDTTHLIVTSENETALVDGRSIEANRARFAQEGEIFWHVLTDRHLYRTGETVHVKGWVRRRKMRVDGDMMRLPAGLSVHYTVLEPQRNQIAEGTVLLTEAGGFDLTIPLPDNVNLGFAMLDLRLSAFFDKHHGNEYRHRFGIKAFRRPDVELTLHKNTSDPIVAGQQIQLSIAAAYFSGEPVAGAATEWKVTGGPSYHFKPPNWSGFTFVSHQPPSASGGRGGRQSVLEIAAQRTVPLDESLAGRTDGNGMHRLEMMVDADRPSPPMHMQATASVHASNRQRFEERTHFLVHSCALYVGLRSSRYFVRRGEPLEVEAIVTDIDGHAVVGHVIQLKYEQLARRFQNGKWQDVVVGERVLRELISAETPLITEFTPDKEAQYRITATIVDADGHQNQSQITRRVGHMTRRPEQSVTHQSVTILADKKFYVPGDSTELLIEPPFLPAEGLLIVERNGILTKRRVQLKAGNNILTIPITEAHVPNLNVQLELVGVAKHADGSIRPAYATGRVALNISPRNRKLTVKTSLPSAKTMPGSETQMGVTVHLRNGTPVANAEVAVIVVDEAILALSEYRLAHPINTFYRYTQSRLQADYGRRLLLLEAPKRPDVQADSFRTMSSKRMRSGSAAMAREGSATPALYVRQNFVPLAAFVPNILTDENGQAHVQFKLPDTLTRYRVMVVVAAGENWFGRTETTLTAALPFTLRPAPPRFLNAGDRVDLPIFVHNHTDQPLDAQIGIQADNLELVGVTGKQVTIPSHDQVELRFPALTEQSGVAKFRVVALTSTFNDAVQSELPVLTPATSEVFATYGVLDNGVVQQAIAPPADLFPQYGGLEISSASTAISGLTDALLYIVQHPYLGRSDVLASRLLSVVALRDVLTAFSAENLPSAEQLDEAIQQAIQKLTKMQTPQGSFPLYPSGSKHNLFTSVFAAHALIAANTKGYVVSSEVQTKLSSFLQNIDTHFDAIHTPAVRRMLRAYALHVRHLTGDNDVQGAVKLLDEAKLQAHSLDTLAWLWPILAASAFRDGDRARAIERHIANRVVETAGAAHFVTRQIEGDYLMLRSNRRTDAFLLSTLIDIRPNSDLIPKLVTGLLQHRVRGRWRNLQENVFISLAIGKYFATFEAEPPDFAARFWLDKQFVGTHCYQERSTDRHHTHIPTAYLVEQKQEAPHQIVIDKTGVGRLHYRLGLRYAPRDLRLKAQDRGYLIQRTYEGVDNDEDVIQMEGGQWRVRLGALVRVRIRFVTVSRRIHTAMVDRLPAGLEPLNQALKLAEQPPNEPFPRSVETWWRRYWYDHQNIRDDRAEAFTMLLWAGEYEYSYYARATTSGTYIVPPAKVEEMYAPEVFGRTATDQLVVSG
ncbi:MAG: alpha-2-macroglobulin family protein [Candidatus Promineifilaceae bacterium]